MPDEEREQHQLDPRFAQLTARTRTDLQTLGWEITAGLDKIEARHLGAGTHLVSRFRAYALPRGTDRVA